MSSGGSPLSIEGDLTPLARDIEEVFEKHGFEDPAFGVAFTLPKDRKKVSWVTNVSRDQGIELFGNTAIMMDEHR